MVSQRPTRPPVEREYVGSNPTHPIRGHSPPRPHPCVMRRGTGGPARAPTHTPFTERGEHAGMGKELTMRNGEVVDAKDVTSPERLNYDGHAISGEGIICPHEGVVYEVTEGMDTDTCLACGGEMDK